MDLKQLSMTTMELSTIIPMPTTRPPSDMRLMLMSKAAMRIKAASTEMGMVTPMMKELFHSPKKNTSTRAAITRPSMSEVTTLMMLS